MTTVGTFVASQASTMSSAHLIAGEEDASLWAPRSPRATRSSLSTGQGLGQTPHHGVHHPRPPDLFLGLPVIIDASPGYNGRDPGDGGVDAHGGAPVSCDLHAVLKPP